MRLAQHIHLRLGQTQTAEHPAMGRDKVKPIRIGRPAQRIGQRTRLGSLELSTESHTLVSLAWDGERRARGTNLKVRELRHDGGHDLVGFAGLHALRNNGFDVVAAHLNSKSQTSSQPQRAVCWSTAAVAYHALRIEKLQHVGAARVGAGVYAATQPAPATTDTGL